MIKTLAMMALLYSGCSSAFCFIEVANSSRVDPLLLGAIVKQESGFNPKAQNVNRKNGVAVSEDIGFAQINSSWLSNRRLKSVFPDITRERLYRDPCYNLHVSAWILVNSCNMKKMDWDCVGAYNAGVRLSPKSYRLRRSYAKLIHGHFINYNKHPYSMQRDIERALRLKTNRMTQ